MCCRVGRTGVVLPFTYRKSLCRRFSAVWTTDAPCRSCCSRLRRATPVPKHDAFQRGFIRLTPQTLRAVNDLVVRAAVELGLEDGAKLRVDTTVVQTDIHHPTDNTLLWDVVRVVTRLVRRLAKALELRRIKGFCDRTRAARPRMYETQRMTTTQRPQQQTRPYLSPTDTPQPTHANPPPALVL